MMQATMVYQTTRIAEYFATGEQPAVWDSGTSNLVPHQAFKTSDSYVAVGVNTQEQWRALCAALEMPDLLDDPRFQDNPSRVLHRDHLIPRLETAFLERATQAWVEM